MASITLRRPKTIHDQSSWSIHCKCLLIFLFVSVTKGACPTASDVQVPDNAEHIIPAGYYKGCSFVTARIAKGITMIGDGAFYGNTQLTTVYLPSTLEVIGSAAFGDCTSLKTMDLPSGLLELRDSSLRNTALTSIALPPSLIVLLPIALLQNRVLTSVSFRGTSPTTNGVFAIEDNSAIYTADYRELVMVINSVTEVKIHKNTWVIGGHALCFCDMLTNTQITIPDSVVQIRECAFYACLVTHLVIGSRLETVNEQAFDYMVYLQWIEMPVASGYFQAKDGVLYTSGLRKVVAYPVQMSGTTFVIPAQTEGFDFAAFGVTSVVTTFEVNTNSKYLKCSSSLVYTRNMSVLVRVPPALSGAVTVDTSTTVIGCGAFYGCKKVTSITLPQKLTTIREHAFAMSEFTALVLPQTLSFIGSSAFQYSYVKSLEFPSSMKTIQSEACFAASNLASVVIKAAKVIEEKAFMMCYELNSVTLPDTLTSIGRAAFHGIRISQIVLPSKQLTVLHEECFAQCASLTSITIPFCVQRVEGRAFAESINLASVTFKNCETWVSHTAFQGIANVKVKCVSTSRFTLAPISYRHRRCVWISALHYNILGVV